MYTTTTPPPPTTTRSVCAVIELVHVLRVKKGDGMGGRGWFVGPPIPGDGLFHWCSGFVLPGDCLMPNPAEETKHARDFRLQVLATSLENPELHKRIKKITQENIIKQVY